MLHGRQRGQSQNGIVQTLRQARLTGRLSPQQSLKKVGPVITEVLCTSVRPKGQNGQPDSPKRQKSRPNNGGEAVLSVGERANVERGPNQREPVSRNVKETVGALQTPVTPLKTGPPSTILTTSNGQAPAGGILKPEKRVSLPPPPPIGKDAVKIQLSGPSHGARGRRISKALPSVPPPVPSPRKATFASPPAFVGPFRTQRDKIVRGSPSVPTAPDMKEKSGSSASEYSSGSAYSSAESTWNMINNMMRAVGEEEVQQARNSRIRTSSDAERSSCVEFPRMRSSQESGEGWSSDTYTWSGRTARTSSMASSSTYCSSVPLKDKEDQQDKDMSLARRGSVASVFSIVIQPTRERSYEARDALVPAESFPSRIKDILHDMHDGVESTLCTRKWTISRSHSPEDSELHPDIAMAIDSLRRVTVEDILFD